MPFEQFGLDYGPAPQTPVQNQNQSLKPDPEVEKAKEKAAAEIHAKMLLNQPQTEFGDTPDGLMKELVVNKGNTFGQALDIVQSLYSKGNPYVRSLPGIDEFVNKIPGTFELTGKKLAEDVSQPMARLGAGINYTSKALGGPEIFKNAPTTEQIDFMQKLEDETRPTNYTSDVVGAIPGLLAFGEMDAALAPVTTTIGAKLFPGAAAGALGRLASGGPLTEDLVKLAGNAKLARWFGKATAVGGASLGYDVLYGKEPSLQGAAVNAAGAFVLGRITNKLMGRPVIDKAYEFLSRASGVPVNEITSRIGTLDSMFNALNAANAPPQFTARVVSVGAENYGDEFGRYVGRWAARNSKTPEELQSLLAGIKNEDFHKAAVNGYTGAFRSLENIRGLGTKYEQTANYLRYLGADDEYLGWISKDRQTFQENAAKFFGRKVAQTGEAPDILYDLTRDLRPRYHKLAIDEYNNTLDELGLSGAPKFRGEAKMYLQGKPKTNVVSQLVVDKPYETGAGARYYPPMSKWHIDAGKSGPVNIVAKEFTNPVEVPFGPKQMPAYALINQLKGNPKLSSAVLTTLNNKLNNMTGIDFSTTNDVIDSIAARLAKRFGYDSVIYRGETPDKDVYVDLAKATPLEASAEKIVNEMEKSLANAGKRALGKNFLTAALTVGGIGAGLAFNPRKSEGAEIPVEGLGKAVGETAGKLGKFLEGFTELITPESKALRPPEHLDFRSPSYDPLRPTKPWGHEDIAVNLLSGADKADLVDAGYVRALRENDVLGVEFNPVHPAATENALDFLRRNWRLGDTVRIDRGKQSGEFYLPGQAAQFIRKGIVPAVGIGLGIMATQEEAKAANFEPVIKAASKFDKIGDFIAALEPRLGQIIHQISSMTGETKPAKLVETLIKVRDDVHNLSGNVHIDPFDLGPDYVGVNVSHRDLGPFPLVTVNGVVDPDSGTWYPEVKSSPIGVGKETVKKIFEAVKEKQPLIQKLGKVNSLAGILAATWVGKEIYDLVNPSPAGAIEIPTKPLTEMLGKGIRGVGEGAMEDIARSKSVDDLYNATLNRVKNMRAKTAAMDMSNMPSNEAAFLNFDNGGQLTPESQQLLGSADSGEGLNSLFRWRPPWSASENPAYQAWYNQLAAKLDAVFRGEGSTRGQLQNRAAEILDRAGLKDTEYDELYRGLHGMRRTAAGGTLQTAPGISAKVNDVAKQLHDEIIDPLWQINTGINPRAVGIMHDLGLEETQANWRLIKQVQDRKVLPDGTVEPLPQGVDARHQSAAQAMSGMINPKPWQWRNLDAEYSKAKFIIIPVEQERAALQEQLNNWAKRYGANPPQDVKDRMMVLVRRLKELDVQERKGQLPLKPRMDVLHSNKFAPFQDGPNVPVEVQEKNPNRLLMEHINGALEKMFFDEQNHYTAAVTDYFANSVDSDGLPAASRALGDYMKEFMNTINGVKAMRGDAAMVQQINALLRNVKSNKRVDAKSLRKIANGIMEYTWITKMGFGLRFPIVNSVQPLQTTAMITGFGPLFRAYAKVMNNPAIWDEALAAKVMRLGESRAMSEIQPQGKLSGVAKAFDWLPNKSENFNRVVTYQAAKDQALAELAKTGTLKVPHFVRTFNKQVLSTGNPEKIAQEYAAAVVRTTQFMFGPEGRPLMLSGGSARKIVTQFKSFTAAYADLLVGAMQHARQTGDVMPLVRGAMALMMVGGVGTILPYETIRHQLIKQGYDVLPQDQAGLGYLLATAASTFGQPDTAEEVKQALNLLQISGSFSPLNLPNLSGDRGWESLTQFAAGPTLGSMMQIGKAGLDAVTGQKGVEESLRNAAKGVSPLLASIPEGVQMMNYPQINDAMSQLGYRGGIYSPTGKLLAKNQGMLGALARALNLQPSMRSQRYRYVQDIQSALDGGQNALAQKLLQEAQDMGFIFSKTDFSGLKGNATRKRNVEIKPNEPLR